MKTPRVIFYLRFDKLNKNREAPIYCRITVDRKRCNFSIGRYILPERWDETDQMRKARKPGDRELNDYMESIRARIKEIERELMDRKTPVTAENIRNVYGGKKGKAQKSKTVVGVFDLYNAKLKELVKSEQLAQGTLDRYEQTLKHIKGYLKHEYNKTDMLLEELENKFVINFDHYLRTERKNEKGRVRKCANNSAVKYVGNFRTVINWAVDQEWLKYFPFKKYKRKIITVDREFLTPEEIDKIQNKEISIPRLAVIRDILVFSIYSGFGYSDVKKLSPADVRRHIDGKLWIFSNRQKTKVRENVMLLDPALELIEKYKSHPECLAGGTLFPVPSNQKVNAYLKELADICGITKNLTFHLGRHTFATSVMLANGASLETTRDVIGHKNLKQTQHYAKMLNPRVSEEMNKVNENLRQKNKSGGDLKVVK